MAAIILIAVAEIISHEHQARGQTPVAFGEGVVFTAGIGRSRTGGCFVGWAAGANHGAGARVRHYQNRLCGVSRTQHPNTVRGLRLTWSCANFHVAAYAVVQISRSGRFYRALISSNFESARSNLSLKSHIASRISRKVADVFALSARPKVKMLLFRRYPMILGSAIL